MANFNTYQTRQFYVAKSVIDSGEPDAVGEIKMGQADRDIFFKYFNADGLVTRTDTIKLDNISSIKYTLAADMDTKLKAHTVSVDTSVVSLGNNSPLIGKTLTVNITVHQVLSYDASDSMTFTAAVVGDATNTASAAAFHKALAIAIAKALPQRKYPFLKVFSNGTEVKANTAASAVTGAAAGVVLVEAAQKYVRGRMSNEPFPFSVAFHLHGSNVEDIPWGTDVVADSAITNNTVIPSVYALADLEAFAMGEKGDMYRGSVWPNNYDPIYMIDLSKSYNVLTIEYFYQGGAENIQKSPRMIQIAAEGNVAKTLYDGVVALMEGGSESSDEGGNQIPG